MSKTRSLLRPSVRRTLGLIMHRPPSDTTIAFASGCRSTSDPAGAELTFLGVNCQES